MDHFEKLRKKEARAPKKQSAMARKARVRAAPWRPACALAAGACAAPALAAPDARGAAARPSQLIGLKAKMYAKKRHAEKVTMKKTIAEHSERDNKHKAEEAPKGAVPHYLLDREQARGPTACNPHTHTKQPVKD